MNHASYSAYVLRTREELGMTQQEFASALHVSSQTVSSWETGRRVPNETVVEWCKAARVAVSQLKSQGDENWKQVLIAAGLGALLGLLVGSLISKN